MYKRHSLQFGLIFYLWVFPSMETRAEFSGFFWTYTRWRFKYSQAS